MTSVVFSVMLRESIIVSSIMRVDEDEEEQFTYVTGCDITTDDDEFDSCVVEFCCCAKTDDDVDGLQLKMMMKESKKRMIME